MELPTVTLNEFGITPIEQLPYYTAIARNEIEAKYGNISELMNTLTDAEKSALQKEYEGLMRDKESQFNASVKRAKADNKIAVSLLNKSELRELVELLNTEHGYSGADYVIAEMSRLGIIEYSIKKTGKGVLVGKKTLGEGTVSPFKAKYKLGKLTGEVEFSSYCTRKNENGTYCILGDIRKMLG